MFCDALRFLGRCAKISPRQTSCCRKNFLQVGSFENQPLLYWLGGSICFSTMHEMNFPSLSVLCRSLAGKSQPHHKAEETKAGEEGGMVKWHSGQWTLGTSIFQMWAMRQSLPRNACPRLDTCNCISLNCVCQLHCWTSLPISRHAVWEHLARAFVISSGHWYLGPTTQVPHVLRHAG